MVLGWGRCDSVDVKFVNSYGLPSIWPGGVPPNGARLGIAITISAVATLTEAMRLSTGIQSASLSVSPVRIRKA
jgi:hypothetical protein